MQLISLGVVELKVEFKVEITSQKALKKARLYSFVLFALSFIYIFYSVFLLLSQPTRPTPMLLNRTAPGAGIGL